MTHSNTNPAVCSTLRMRTAISPWQWQPWTAVQVPDFNQSTHAGSDLVNLSYINDTYLSKQIGGTMHNPITFLNSLPNNQKQIHNLGIPQFNSSATNKQYVDGEIAKIPQMDTTQFIKKDGSVPMESNLNMGGGGGGNKIENLKTPEGDNNASTKGYIDETLSKSHILASSKNNVFQYLDNPDDTSSEYNITVNAFTNFKKHVKKAFEITLQKDTRTNDYRSRMGFNIYLLPIGTYTIIFEYFPPEMTNIQLSCQATTAYVHKQVQKDFTDYSKLLVQINNNSKDTPDYIYFTMHGTAAVSPVQAYLIVYGIKDWSDSVNPEIYDHKITNAMFEYKNGNMFMNTELNMNNHSIKNVPRARYHDDVLTKSSINISKIRIYGYINQNKILGQSLGPITFENIFLNTIAIFNPVSSRGSSDRLQISFKDTNDNIRIMNYSFTFGRIDRLTIININHHFPGGITLIKKLQHSNRGQYIVTYQSIYI